jgi:tRNA pseudouridine38-40 synthase
VESALCRVLGGEDVRVDATGRTDAGVHARAQVVGFRARTPRDARALRKGLDALLPDDIACLEVRPAPEGFDPRRWTRGKHYRYRILLRDGRCPFRARWTWRMRPGLDLDAMALAAQRLVGTHDFSSFRASGCGAAHAERTLVSAAVRHDGTDEVHLDFHGNGFLRHQVRIMVGTLVDVGQGRRAPTAVAEALAARDRAAAGPTAPAHGLWLMSADVGDTPRVSPS